MANPSSWTNVTLNPNAYTQSTALGNAVRANSTTVSANSTTVTAQGFAQGANLIDNANPATYTQVA